MARNSGSAGVAWASLQPSAGVAGTPPLQARPPAERLLVAIQKSSETIARPARIGQKISGLRGRDGGRAKALAVVETVMGTVAGVDVTMTEAGAVQVALAGAPVHVTFTLKLPVAEVRANCSE